MLDVGSWSRSQWRSKRFKSDGYNLAITAEDINSNVNDHLVSSPEKNDSDPLYRPPINVPRPPNNPGSASAIFNIKFFVYMFPIIFIGIFLNF